MLVISRRQMETVYVDGPCRITVLKSQCKLGFDGNAKVARGELVEKPAANEGKSSIFLVDDDADLLNAYQQYLEHFGFDVEPFDNGGQFLEYANGNKHASAAVLDLRLAQEDLDGLQILQQLRAWNHDYPVILLTGYGDVETCRRAFHGGCYTFLQKPMAPEDLASALKGAVERFHEGEYGTTHLFSSLAG